MELSAYRKAVAAACVALGNLILLFFQDRLPAGVTVEMILGLLNVVALPAIVYLVPNEPTETQERALRRKLARERRANP